jgi:4-hydroxy-tetrahydrodipicolinate synthase
MPTYTKDEARDWAREKLVGVANVTVPTMTSDFKALNEKAIRHDVETAIGHGFIGSLACSEVAMTMPEYGQFCEIMVDQSQGRMLPIHHAAFNTLEDNIEAVKIAERAGVEFILLCYPAYFYPRSLEEVYAYTRAFCDATDLAVMLFPVPTWGFSRLHPADMPVPLLRRLVDDCPNIVAIKAEGGMPNIMAQIEVHREFHEEVVISSPLEYDLVPLGQLMPIPFSGTNYSAYFGDWLPRVHALLQQGKFDEATQHWYAIDPARKAVSAVGFGGGGLLNRMLWKYHGWLQGYNGGPLRGPTARVYSKDMVTLRRGLELAGLKPTSDRDEDFFIGRNPD